MIINIIMAVCFYPVLFIMYFVMKHYGRFNNGRIFNCGISYDKSQSVEIQEVQKSFVKQMNILLLVFLVIPLVAFFNKYDSIVVTIWIVWTMVLIIAVYVPFAKAHGKIVNIKNENGWDLGAKDVVYVDTSNAGRIRTIRINDFIVPFIICLTACIYVIFIIDSSMYGKAYNIAVSLSFSLCTILICPIALMMDKKKSVVICSDSNVNANYNRSLKKIWKDFWMSIIYSSAVLTEAVSFTLNTSTSIPVMIIGSIIFTLVISILAVNILSRKNKLYNSYKKYINDDFKAADDSKWIFGLIYYNPRDKHLCVEDKVGVGLTVNMATWLGKVSIVFAIAIYVFMIGVCGFLIRHEFTPINLHVDNYVLVCSHTSDKYKLDVDKISDVKMLNNLPDLSKNQGTNMRSLYLGDFSSKEYGRCKVILNPKNGKFIELKYEGKTYLLSSGDDKSTEEVYNIIK